MPQTAQQVIDNARLRHQSFDSVNIPNGIALGLLNSYVSRMHGQIIEIEPAHLALQTTTALPLTDFESGILLPPFVMVMDAHATLDGGTGIGRRADPVAIINYQQRFDSGVWPSVFIVRDAVFLKGVEQEWSIYDSIAITYAPSYSDITSLNTELPLPDMCVGAVTDWLAALFAVRRSAEVGPEVVGIFRALADNSAAIALENLSSQKRTERWSPREY